MIIKWIIPVLIGAIVFFLTGCLFESQASGNSTSETTNGITVSGILADSTDTGVSGFPLYLLKQSVDEKMWVDTVAKTSTDKEGRYRYDNVIEGNYFIMGNSGAFATKSEIIVVHSESKDTTMGQRLKKSGSLLANLVFDFTGKVAFIRLENSPYLFRFKSDGSLLAQHIVPEKYRYHIFLKDTATSRLGNVASGEIKISPQSVTHLENIKLPVPNEMSDTLLLDDFEDGDERHLRNNVWYAFPQSFADSGDTTRHELSIISPGAQGSQYAARSEVEFGTKKRIPLLGTNLSMGVKGGGKNIFDFRRFSHFLFNVRGSGVKVTLQMRSELEWRTAELFTVDSISSEWESVNVSYSEAQADFTDKQITEWNGVKKSVSIIHLKIAPIEGSQTGWIEFDNLKFVFDQ